MRRKEKEIIDSKVLNQIINNAKVCRLGLANENRPYIVPLSFGFKDNVLYFHSAPGGTKIEILNINPHVCFEFDLNVELIQAEKPCQWGMKYQSITGHGKAVFVHSLEDKRKALEIIMRHYTDKHFSFQDSEIARTAIFKVLIEGMTGKQSG